jgi:hypothetical protein
MAQQSSRRIVVFCASAIALAVVFSLNPLAAQTAARRPLTYDVVDSWRSIQGTRLSQDGQWLAYALTAPGDDGELVVRNLKTNQDLKSPRGTNPTFTPDGKFVIFTIVPTKAETSARIAARARPRRRRPCGWPRGWRRRRHLAQFTRHHESARRPGDDGRASRDLPAA